jgi:ATP-dependent Clp protease adapter protein ClpS
MDLSASLRSLQLLIRRILGVVDTPSSVIFLPQTSLLARPGFVPSGFKCGLEILNDDRTPMEFVVSVLGDHIGFDRKDAIRTMLTIHSQGGALLAMSSMEEATKAAQAITADAAERNYLLVCRAVDAAG